MVYILGGFSGSNSTPLLSRTEFLWPAVMIASSAFQAGASIIKVVVYTNKPGLFACFRLFLYV